MHTRPIWILRSNGPDMAYKVLQYNCRKSASVVDDLRGHLENTSYHVIALQEPQLPLERDYYT